MSDAPFKLDIDPDAVNRVLSEAILQSTIGKQIQSSADDYINKFRDNWQSRQHVDKAVQEVVSRIIREEVEKNRDQIAEWVQKQLTKEMLDTMLEKMWQKWDRGW